MEIATSFGVAVVLAGVAFTALGMHLGSAGAALSFLSGETLLTRQVEFSTASHESSSKAGRKLVEWTVQNVSGASVRLIDLTLPCACQQRTRFPIELQFAESATIRFLADRAELSQSPKKLELLTSAGVAIFVASLEGDRFTLKSPIRGDSVRAAGMPSVLPDGTAVSK